MSDTANLEAEYAAITDLWSPRVVAVANGQYLKLAKALGEFVWHSHAEEDELFMVHRGELRISYRDRPEAVIRPGEVHVVPRGVEHRPYAPQEALIMFFEPAATRHTGEVEHALTRSVEAQTAHLARPT